MTLLCSEQEACEDFSAGHKRKAHHVRMAEPCVYHGKETCPMVGHACDIAKIKRIKEELKRLDFYV